MKKCSKCSSVKELTEFHKDKQKSDGLTSHCKVCISLREKDRYKSGSKSAGLAKYKSAHPEKYKLYTRRSARKNVAKRVAYNRLYRSLNKTFNQFHCSKRRALSTGTFSFQDLEARFSVFGNVCAYCKSDSKLTIDHVKPLSKGGLHILSNIRPACKSCNSSKNNKSLKEWLCENSTS